MLEGAHTYLGRNILVKVTGIFWIAKFRAVRRRIAVNICPVDAVKPWVGLMDRE